MKPSRKLVLKCERLTALAADDLRQVVAADAVLTVQNEDCLSLNPCRLSEGITCTCTIRLCA